MTIMAIIAAILGTIGISATGAAINDVLSALGKEAASTIRQLAAEINSRLSANEQALIDFKSASADKRAGIINSMISSSGMGARIESLRKQYKQLIKKESELAAKVKEKRESGNKTLANLNALESNAGSGLIGAIQARTTQLPSAEEYSVGDPSQNINGGLMSAERN